MKTLIGKRPHASLICVCLAVLLTGYVQAQSRIRIVSPRAHSVVSRIEDFSGTMEARGIPFLFVRPVPVPNRKNQALKGPLKKNSIDPKTTKAKSISPKALIGSVGQNPWWIQKNCLVDLNGKFAGQVHFGNGLTPDKTKFEVFAVLVSNPDHAKKLREMYSIDEVPRSIGPRSRTLTFELDKSKASSTPNSFVVYPTNLDLVGRRETLVGIIPKYGMPVVFVKAVDEDVWWVQSIIKPDEYGGFKCDLYFGNENTPNQSKFQIAVAIVEDQVAQKLRKGSTKAELPRDHLGLQTVTVQLEHEITFRNASNQRISK